MAVGTLNPASADQQRAQRWSARDLRQERRRGMHGSL